VTRRSVPSPISAFALLQQEVSDLFRRLSTLDHAEHAPASEWCPPVDVYEARDRLVAVIEVPGLAAESLKVVFRDRALVVSGERRARRSGGAVSFLCLERSHGRFERAIPLPVPVDVAHARATLGGGLLTVSMPRLRERRGAERAVPIEREPAE
jgi:HSP20 family protein